MEKTKKFKVEIWCEESSYGNREPSFEGVIEARNEDEAKEKAFNQVITSWNVEEINTKGGQNGTNK